MRPHLLSHVWSALLALGLTTGLSIPALAVPAGIAAPVLAGAASAPGSDGVTLVRDGGKYKNRRHYRKHGQYSQRNWNKGSSHWSGKRYANNYKSYKSYKHYNSYKNYNSYKHYKPYKHYKRHHYRKHHNNYRYRYGSGIYFSLGVPIYRYVQPRVYYGTYGGGSAHVAWCYNHYRSYRAWDNTYQPYNGPRRLCWSPYS